MVRDDKVNVIKISGVVIFMRMKKEKEGRDEAVYG